MRGKIKKEKRVEPPLSSEASMTKDASMARRKYRDILEEHKYSKIVVAHLRIEGIFLIQ